MTNLKITILKGLMFWIYFFVVCIIPYTKAYAQCGSNDFSFRDGEILSYNIQYHWGFIWLTAGEVSFSVNKENRGGKECYHFIGNGRTYDSYDWFYKVRDTYESWCSIDSFKPIEYMRNVSEGGYTVENKYVFNYDDSVVFSSGLREGKFNIDSTHILTDCLFDVMSLVYYTRAIEFNRFVLNEEINLDIILDDEKHNISIKYLGREILSIGNEFVNTFKISSKLVEGSIFKKGDEMIIWVSDDENKIPIKVKADILVGAIEANLKN